MPRINPRPQPPTTLPQAIARLTALEEQMDAVLNILAAKQESEEALYIRGDGMEEKRLKIEARQATAALIAQRNS